MFLKNCMNRSDRTKIRGLVRELEEDDIARVPLDALLKKIDYIGNLLVTAGAADNSSFWNEIEVLRQRFVSSSKHIVQPSVPNFSSTEKREYVGMSGNTKVMFLISDEVLRISRLYSGDIFAKWSFNPDGRIIKVILQPFLSQQEIEVVKTYPRINLNDWDRGDMVVGLLPPESSSINSGIFDMPTHQMYSALMRYGHGEAFNLLTRLQEGSVRESLHRHAGQRNLVEIAKDDSLMYVVDNIAKVIPFVDHEPGSHSATVHYKENLKYKEKFVITNQ